MADYTNLTCPVCKQAFSAEDDIVVCPICGTPHHRVCYAKENKCANFDWHAENKIFDAEEETKKINEEKYKEQQNEREAEQKNHITVCHRCGYHNDGQAIFCKRCGAPVSQSFYHGDNSQPNAQGGFFQSAFSQFENINANEKIDGIEGWKLSAVVRENHFRFMMFFRLFSQKKCKTSFNFSAFLFSSYYFLYRKMYGLGIALSALILFFNVPSVILSFTNEYLSEILGTTVTSGLSLTTSQFHTLSIVSYISSLAIMAVRIFCGIFANWLYFKKCKKVVAEIDKTAVSREDFILAANKKGGVNRIIIIAIIGIIWLASILLIGSVVM